jgi:hypothetical protein
MRGLALRLMVPLGHSVSESERPGLSADLSDASLFNTPSSRKCIPPFVAAWGTWMRAGIPKGPFANGLERLSENGHVFDE